MSKYFLILAFFCLISCSTKKSEKRNDSTGKEYTFNEYEYYFEFNDNFDSVFYKNGDYIEFYPNGKIKMECKYSKGNLIDIILINSVDGQSLYQNPLVSGAGDLIFLNENGVKIFESKMKSGHEIGPQVEYYTNGKIKSTINLKHGRFHGKATMHYESGNLKGTIMWNDGRKTDTSYAFHENGSIARLTPYYTTRNDSTSDNELLNLIGQEHGITKAFYPDGNINWYTQHDKGFIKGLSEVFYQNGNVKERIYFDINYQNDMKYKVLLDSLGSLVDSITFDRISNTNMYDELKH